MEKKKKNKQEEFRYGRGLFISAISPTSKYTQLNRE